MSKAPTLASPEDHKFLSPRKVATLMAVGLLGLVGAGCETGGGKAKERVKPAPAKTEITVDDAFNPERLDPNRLSAIDALGNEINARVVIGDLLSQSASEPDTAFRLIRRNPGKFDDLEEPAEQVKADDLIVTLAAGGPGGGREKKARQQAAALKDPKTRAKTEQAIEAIVADDIVTDLSNSHEAKADEQARQRASKLPDEDLRQVTLKAIDAQDAFKAIEELGASDSSVKKSQAELTDIQDKEIRALAEEALDSYKPDEYGGGEVDSELENQLESLAYHERGKVENLKGKARDALSVGPDYLQFGDPDPVGDAVAASDRKITRQVQAHNVLEEWRGKVKIDPLENRETVIDLTGVRGTKQIPDLGEEYISEELKLLNQFAQVYVEDGRIKLGFEKGNNLSNRTQAQIDALVRDIEPLLHAAFTNGDLLSVRFIASDDFEPYYRPDTREIFMILAGDKSTSIDQMRSTLIHEVVHSLTRSAFDAGAKVSKQEFADMAKACNALRSDTYDQLETTLSAYPEILTDLRAEAKPEHRKIFDKLIQYVNKDRLDDLLVNEHKNTSDFSLTFNNCLPHGLNTFLQYVGDYFGVEVRDYETEDEAKKDKLAYLYKTEAFDKMAEKWVELQTLFSLYSKLNEAAYVTTDYEYKDLLGHSEDAASEMVASVTDAAISFNSHFTKAVAELPADQKSAVLSAVHVSLALISNRHPSLKAYSAALEHRIRTGAKKTK